MAIVALVTVLTALCYSWLPAGKRKVIPQIPGAFLATVACFVLSLGFRIYVDNFAGVTALYGTLAAVALMLLWLYLLSFAVITGAFVNRLIADKKRKSDDVDEGGAEEAATE